MNSQLGHMEDVGVFEEKRRLGDPSSFPQGTWAAFGVRSQERTST